MSNKPSVVLDASVTINDREYRPNPWRLLVALALVSVFAGIGLLHVLESLCIALSAAFGIHHLWFSVPVGVAVFLVVLRFKRKCRSLL